MLMLLRRACPAHFCIYRVLLFALALTLFFSACGDEPANTTAPNSHQKMIDLLAETRQKSLHPDNLYASDRRIQFSDSVIAAAGNDMAQRLNMQFVKAATLLEYGDEAQSVAIYEDLLKYVQEDTTALKRVLKGLGVAYLRLGERNNCVYGHNAESCILPIKGGGVHHDKTGSRKAIQVYEKLLTQDPDDYDSRWLLNIAYMTLGEYPAKVPAKWLIPNLDKYTASQRVTPFLDLAPDLKLNTNNRSGGVIVDDFDNDGFLDIVSSAWGLDDPMHFFRNNGDGTFSDLSQPSGLSAITGGLNMTSTDYNNDGWLDIFVLRGGWQGQFGFGNQPNSLLRNNGDGTFTDVTEAAGILSFHPTQTATWNDFNNDGWLDVFIGNETTSPDDLHPCELYLNNQDGTFTNTALPNLVHIIAYVKGVASGDYNNDGWPDIFISTQHGQFLLLENQRVLNAPPMFSVVNEKAGFQKGSRTFPTGFFDFDNDGWLDIFVCNYDFDRPLSHYAALEALKKDNDETGKVRLFKNNRDGTFSDVSQKANLNPIVFAMGANFGDIDNDGFLDLYFGTGNPNYRSLVPNKLLKNIGGKRFEDVTVAARVGNLQKGHGVAFADLDNDGDQDIFTDMGGAFRGDAYPSSLYLNMEENANHWIYLKLEGTKSNRAAIGAKVTVKFTENGKKRMVYREVNSGASFGCSPLRREIGIGAATMIDEITIQWPASGITQTVTNVQPNQLLKIKEGTEGYEQVQLKKMVFRKADGSIPMCAPTE